jgi:hypothetical protein
MADALLEPERYSDQRNDFGLKCRLFATPAGCAARPPTIAIALAGVVGTLIERTIGDTPTAKVRSVAPVLILAIGTFIVLDQRQIAQQIVTITYAALLGGLFLAMALAFGLGGRDVANRMLSDAYDRGRSSARFRRDLADERDRARAEGATPSPSRAARQARCRPAPDWAMAPPRSGVRPADHPARARVGQAPAQSTQRPGLVGHRASARVLSGRQVPVRGGGRSRVVPDPAGFLYARQDPYPAPCRPSRSTVKEDRLEGDA